MEDLEAGAERRDGGYGGGGGGPVGEDWDFYRFFSLKTHIPVNPSTGFARKWLWPKT